MLISRHLNLCILHNPRTGTQAVKSVFKEFSEEVLEGMSYDAKTGEPYISTYMKVPRLASEYPEVLESCHVMGVVRNPYTRFVSAYLGFLEVFPYSREAHLKFPDFVKRLDQVRVEHDWMYSQFRPQWQSFVHPLFFACILIKGSAEDQDDDVEDEVLESRHKYVSVDTLYRYEFLETEVQRMSKSIGFFPRNGLPAYVENKAREDKKRRLMSQLFEDFECLRVVNRLYAKDFVLFGYKPDMGSLAVQPLTTHERIESTVDPFWRGAFFPEGLTYFNSEFEKTVAEQCSKQVVPYYRPRYAKWLFQELPSEKTQ